MEKLLTHVAKVKSSLRLWFAKVCLRSISVAKALRAFIKGDEFIVGVAIVVDGLRYELPMPKRHHHCIHLAWEDSGKSKMVVCESQGFITSLGRYVDRKEALIIARNAGQLLKRHFHATELFSESVW